MAMLRVTESGGDGARAVVGGHEEYKVRVSIDGGDEYEVRVSDPFNEAEEQDLEWYFEHWLAFPVLNTVRAKMAAASITRYGESLFTQLLKNNSDLYARYKQLNFDQLRIEIVGSPAFQHLHWEALRDPAEFARPLALQAPIVRRDLKPKSATFADKAWPTINLLIVTARPYVERDVSYRTISRPLVKSLNQATAPVRIDMVRPGTYHSLVNKLEDVHDQHGAGFYHIVHFDGHGAVLSYDELQRLDESSAAGSLVFQRRYGRGDLEPYEGERAFLFFEDEEHQGKVDPVEADALAGLLNQHKVPVAILNACQSAKQVGIDTETSLGARLMQAGVQTVLAMGYSVTVSAAERLMAAVYEQLFDGQPLANAIRRGRLELYNDKERRAYFNQVVPLEDWLLPVVYQNEGEPLRVRAFQDQEAAAWFERKATAYEAPSTTYGFFGRDLDVLRVEKRLLRHNLLLVRGMGGAGKSTLLRHLGRW